MDDVINEAIRIGTAYEVKLYRFTEKRPIRRLDRILEQISTIQTSSR